MLPRLRVPGGRVFITSYLLDNLISFTADMVLEWDRWYRSLVYCDKKEKEKQVFGRVWSWSANDQLSQDADDRWGTHGAHKRPSHTEKGGDKGMLGLCLWHNP